MNPDDVRVQKIVDLAIEGLLTDGGHHKQWYLEQILLVARGGPFDDLRAELEAADYSWEDGISP